jgi:DNA-binding NarL/FixJ family response regulator
MRGMVGGGETLDKISIILASNHELWWEGLLLLIKERAQDIDILTISYNAVETIDKANQLNPDVILLDEEIEGEDCGEVARRINELNPEIKIIIVIKPYKDVSLSTSFKARAKAYIDKDITYTELESCVRYVAKGGVVVIAPFVARKLLEQVAYYGNKMTTRVEYDVGLSKREKEVLALLTKRGITNREIADTLRITENTVKAHLSRVMEKMQVRNRQQAAILAREKGIVPEAGE